MLQRKKQQQAYCFRCKCKGHWVTQCNFAKKNKNVHADSSDSIMVVQQESRNQRPDNSRKPKEPTVSSVVIPVERRVQGFQYINMKANGKVSQLPKSTFTEFKLKLPEQVTNQPPSKPSTSRNTNEDNRNALPSNMSFTDRNKWKINKTLRKQQSKNNQDGEHSRTGTEGQDPPSKFSKQEVSKHDKIVASEVSKTEERNRQEEVRKLLKHQSKEKNNGQHETTESEGYDSQDEPKNDQIIGLPYVKSRTEKRKRYKQSQKLRKQLLKENDEPESTVKDAKQDPPAMTSEKKKKKEVEEVIINCVDFNVKAISPDNLRLYSLFIEEHVKKIMLSEEDHEKHENIRKNLETFLRNKLSSKVTLDFFGSAYNGFGCQGCDLDMSVDGVPGLKKDARFQIRKLGNLLRQHPRVESDSVLSITNAKVPIVKFTFCSSDEEGKSTRYECDISSGNDLARENTFLLEAYSQIDPRVAHLGVLVKYWAKACGICDASLGSLSSYAWIILVLHYLQNRGVIPVLQELPPVGHRDCPRDIVDNCNVYFFDEIDDLESVWPEGFRPDRNQESLVELFLGFLKYYGEDFDLKTNLITCNTSRTVKRSEHKRFGGDKKSLAIQDPFLLSRNLSAGRHPSVFKLIVDSFRLTYNHLVSRLILLSKPFNAVPRTELECLFDRSIMCAGHDNTFFKHRCKCGRLEPKRRPKHGNCECGVPLPEKVISKKRKKGQKDTQLVMGNLRKQDKHDKSKGSPAPRLGVFVSKGYTKGSSLPVKPSSNSNKKNEASKASTPNKKTKKEPLPTWNLPTRSPFSVPPTQSTSPPASNQKEKPEKSPNEFILKSQPQDLWEQMKDAKGKKNTSRISKEVLVASLYGKEEGTAN